MQTPFIFLLGENLLPHRFCCSDAFELWANDTYVYQRQRQSAE